VQEVVSSNLTSPTIFPVAEPLFSGADVTMKAAVKTHGQKVSRITWVWPVAWAAVIFAASTRAQVIDVGGVAGLDKLVHFVVYGLLGVLICRTGRGVWSAVLAVLLASAYGATDEWHQSFVPSRSAEVADWLADTIGAIVAVAGYSGSNRLRHAMETPARILRRVFGRPVPVSSP
jgi:VanZ family protein